MRWRLGVWLLVMAGITIMVASPPRAAAETGGYPYATKPCVHAPYATYSTTVNWCANYDWGDRPNDTSRANVISPYGYYYRNCTDYVAWEVASLGVAPAHYKGLGDAKAWAAPPATNGLRVDAVPAVGAAAVRTSGTYGHVAFVEAIDASGVLTVSEYNKHADGNFGTRTGTPTSLGFTHFVHFEAFIPTLAAAPVAPAPEPDNVAVPALAVSESTVPDAPGVPTAPVEPPKQQDGATDLSPLKVPEGEHADVASPTKSEGHMSTIEFLDAEEPVTAGERLAVTSFASAAATSRTEVMTLANQQPSTSPEVHDGELRPVATVSQPEPLLDNANVAPPPAAAPLEHIAAALEQPLIATMVPVPHQWWRSSIQSPPSVVVRGHVPHALAQGYVSPLGYWALGGLIGIAVVREYYPSLYLRRYRVTG